MFNIRPATERDSDSLSELQIKFTPGTLNVLIGKRYLQQLYINSMLNKVWIGFVVENHEEIVGFMGAIPNYSKMILVNRFLIIKNLHRLLIILLKLNWFVIWDAFIISRYGKKYHSALYLSTWISTEKCNSLHSSLIFLKVLEYAKDKKFDILLTDISALNKRILDFYVRNNYEVEYRNRRIIILKKLIQ